MKYYEFNINLNKIEFFNSFCGIERVLINGKPVSKKITPASANVPLVNTNTKKQQ